MANKIEFPLPPTPENPTTSPFTDANGQKWVWNSKNWVRQATDPGIPDLVDPTQRYGQSYVRQWNTKDDIGEWALLWGESWYLGAHDTPPLNDGYGGPLEEGMVYYDTPLSKMFVWTGVVWQAFSSKLQVNTVGEYVWDSIAAGIGAGESLPWPDEYGNDRSNWVNGKTFLSVYVDGKRLIHEYDSTKVAGDYTIDWINDNITFVNAIAANARIVVQEGEVQQNDFISPEDNNASGWAFVIDEDDMISNLDTKVPTQQSTKAYIDSEIIRLEGLIGTGGGGGTSSGIIGSVFEYAGPNLTLPPNSLVCNGQLVLIGDFPELFAAIGNAWATTGGVPAPDTLHFRLPPQAINGVSVYSAGVSGTTQIGDYIPSQNKSHLHNVDHSHTISMSSVGNHVHTGSTSNAGTHSHTAQGQGGTYRTDDSGGATVLKQNQGSTSSAGGHNHSMSLNGAGSHNHSATISSVSIDTKSEGGTEARPESVVYLKCIWAY